MTVYYMVPSKRASISGGTRKLFDHAAILQGHGIEAQAVPFLPPTKINPSPGNLYVWAEVYGQYMIDALPEGTPRVAIIQNGYLLDFDGVAAPKPGPHWLYCPDLKAVLVESKHTEDIVRTRFPDLECPVIRFTSSGNGLMGMSSDQTRFDYGPWPRGKVITAFQYKRDDILAKLFTGLELPGWQLKLISGFSDEQVEECLQTSAILAAPISCEGLCATTQEAFIAGCVIVGWPGGPSEYVPSIWPQNGSYPRPILNNSTYGGPMEYLKDRAVIVNQDDIDGLRRALIATAHQIDHDPSYWADRTAENVKWFAENYSREAEIQEIVEIYEGLTA